MPIKHAHTAAGTNDPTKEVSKDRWNADHTIDTYLDLPTLATDPAAPTSELRVYTKSRAGRRLLNVVGPSGVDTALQPALFGNSLYAMGPLPYTTTTLTGVLLTSAQLSYLNTQFGHIATGSTGASVIAATGTAAFASTNALTRMQRLTLTTGTTTSGQNQLFSASTATAMRTLVNTQTGFFYATRIAIDTYLASLRIFSGLAPNNTALAGEPSAQANFIGLAKNSTDTQWYFQIGGTVAPQPQRQNTGVTCTAGQLLDFSMFMPPNGTSITFKLQNAETGAILADNTIINTGLPASTVLLGLRTTIMSTAGTTAKILAINKIYLETDV